MIVMPDLAAIPAGISVFVDTNIFALHFQGKSASCTALFNRIARGEIAGYVNTEVLSDLLHKMMLAEAVTKSEITQQKAIELKQKLFIDRTTISRMPDHQKQFEETLKLGLKVIPISKKLLINTKRERCNHGLMTNDSLHFGCMTYHRIPLCHIATRDGDFEHIDGITVWKPQDVI